jgi:hypothetical protein
MGDDRGDDPRMTSADVAVVMLVQGTFDVIFRNQSVMVQYIGHPSCAREKACEKNSCIAE